jgi:branched-chain amino acid transport system substrate-binding protein
VPTDGQESPKKWLVTRLNLRAPRRTRREGLLVERLITLEEKRAPGCLAGRLRPAGEPPYGRYLRPLLAALALIVPVPALMLTAGAHSQTTPTLTIYSSLPSRGAGRVEAVAIERGARLALDERGGRVGGHRVRYVALGSGGRWSFVRTAANARRAARDRSAIVYIGELYSATSTISMPILNEVPLAQISPSNTAIGLTRDGPGAYGREPDTYYPTGQRHYVRIAPNDIVQGGALAAAMRERGCRRVAALTDGEVYGAGVGVWVRRRARPLGMRIVLSRRINPRARNYRGLAEQVRRRRAHCVVFTGITANGAVRLFEDLSRHLPRVRLFGSDGIAESRFTNPREGGISRRVARRVLISVPTLAPSALPASARLVLGRYRSRYRERFPDPYAIYGYEAMSLALDAIDGAGTDRGAVIRWLFSVRDRDSVLGRYSIDPYGDTTLRSYGIYRVQRGSLSWAGEVQAPD